MPYSGPEVDVCVSQVKVRRDVFPCQQYYVSQLEELKSVNEHEDAALPPIVGCIAFPRHLREAAVDWFGVKSLNLFLRGFLLRKSTFAIGVDSRKT
jgi:hypothetical protein